MPMNTWKGASDNHYIGPGPAIVNLLLDMKFNVTPMYVISHYLIDYYIE